jgi:DNA-binding NarL/FixJ family response regulator
MVRVAIIAPTPALRAGLRALLDHPEIQIQAEAAAPGGISAFLDEVDVLLVAGDNGFASLRYVLAEEGRVAILALANDERPALILRELRLAGWGVLGEDAQMQELQAAVMAIAQGLVVVPTNLAARLIGQRISDNSLEPPIEALTSREQEVLELMSQGLPNKQIARALQISEHTVKFHISAVFAKLGAASRTEAIGLAVRQGLIAL